MELIPTHCVNKEEVRTRLKKVIKPSYLECDRYLDTLIYEARFKDVLPNLDEMLFIIEEEIPAQDTINSLPYTIDIEFKAEKDN